MAIIHVNIGEVKVARKGEFLSAVYGSCVGVGVMWEEKKICGLTHSLLSKSPNLSFEISAKYVSQAIPSLLTLLKVRKEDYAQIKTILVGGGNMLELQKLKHDILIGNQNVEVAKHILNDLGININFINVGGEQGKRITIDSKKMTFEISEIPRIKSVIGE